MSPMDSKELLQIKKYPNRRLYDATRSQHITLHELYDLIQAGHDVQITDTRSGADITNLVLMQIVVEREQLKLGLFPTAILHLLIRSRPQAFQATIEQYFSPFLNVLAESQNQFDKHIRKTFGATMATPMQWANSMMNAFTAGQPSGSSTDEDSISDHAPTVPPAETPTPNDESINELRQQAASLLERIDNLSVANQPTAKKT